MTVEIERDGESRFDRILKLCCAFAVTSLGVGILTLVYLALSEPRSYMP